MKQKRIVIVFTMGGIDNKIGAIWTRPIEFLLRFTGSIRRQVAVVHWISAGAIAVYYLYWVASSNGIGSRIFQMIGGLLWCGILWHDHKTMQTLVFMTERWQKEYPNEGMTIAPLERAALVEVEKSRMFMGVIALALFAIDVLQILTGNLSWSSTFTLYATANVTALYTATTYYTGKGKTVWAVSKEKIDTFVATLASALPRKLPSPAPVKS